MATAGPVAAAVARRFVPPSVRVVELWPGKTLGGTVFASYETRSTLVYRELNVVSALVCRNGRIGFWLPQLYVDSAASRAGGRRIWGLPKDLAEFAGAERTARILDVRAADGARYALHRSGAPLRVPVRLPVPFLSERDGGVLSTWGTLSAVVSPARIRPRIASATYAELGLERPWFGVFLHAFVLTIPGPARVP